MRFKRSNLALKKDDTNRFLPWLIAFMALLAALSIAGLLILKQVAQVFEYNNHNNMTIQIPAGESSTIDDQRVTNVLVALRKVGGVITTTRVSSAEIKNLLKLKN